MKSTRVVLRCDVRWLLARATYGREHLYGDDRKLFLESSRHATEDGPEVNVSPLPSVSRDSRSVTYSTDVLFCVPVAASRVNCYSLFGSS